MIRPRSIGVALLCTLLVAGAACGGKVTRGTPTPIPQPTPTATSAPTATQGVELTATPAQPGPTPTRTPPVTEPVATVSTELTLDVFGLGEETTIRGSSIIVAGRTRPDAVLSINGVIIPVDADGRFEVTVTLDPGPNLVEVVASDLEGNQESRVITVIALPEA